MSILMMWLISLFMFMFASSVSCWVGDVMWSLARRLRSVALLHNMMTSLWTAFCPIAAFDLVCGADGWGFGGRRA